MEHPTETTRSSPQARAAVIGGGPAGLIAATVLVERGFAVDVYDAMPSVGRKLLVAGRGGLNLTNAEPLAAFTARFGPERDRFAELLHAFSPDDLCAFVRKLGIETMVGSTGRVFPIGLKSAPLLRAWVRKLKADGARFHLRHRLKGLGAGPRVTFDVGDVGGIGGAGAPDGVREVEVTPEAVVLALGGASYGRLGSDGLWSKLLAAHGVAIRPFLPSNCGFEVGWSPFVGERYAGVPLKNLVVEFEGERVAGELVITRYGLEGGPLYALSPRLRTAIANAGVAEIRIDLKPAMTLATAIARLEAPRNGRSIASHVRRQLGFGEQRAIFSLLREVAPAADLADPTAAATLVKSLPLKLRGVRPLDEAISSAGGVAFHSVDENLMLRALPGVFIAGEMLDYDVPTGGYLIQAAFATGFRAGTGVASWLESRPGTELEAPEHRD